MYEEIISKKAKIAIIGLGYVGLPIALEFAKKASVIGFDINAERIKMMQKKVGNDDIHAWRIFQPLKNVFLNVLNTPPGDL